MNEVKIQSKSYSVKQVNKLIVLNHLMNTAHELNGEWNPTPEDDKYYIYYSHFLKRLEVCWHNYINCGCVYFKSKELALKAIEIVGEKVLKMIYE